MPPARILPTGLRRAAIYARCATDLQLPRLLNDQLDRCRAHCARRDLIVAEVFADRALSGATTAGRQGLDALMASAAAGEFDVVVVATLDRLSRNTTDLVTIIERLRSAGILLVAISDGDVDEITV